MPLVKKSTYHRKKQTTQQLKNQNQQLQSQLTQLQTELNLLKNANRERERERAKSMPSKDELDSPTTVVGEGEYFPSLEKELEQALDYIATLQAKLVSQAEDHSYKLKQAQFEIDSLRQTLRDAEKLLKEKNQEQENQTSQLNYSHRSFQREVQRRQKLIGKLEAERHQLNQKELIIANQQVRIKELTSDLNTERNQLEKERAENSHYCSAVFHQDAELTHLKQDFSELERIAGDYWNQSQAEIKKWQTEAEVHLEALELTEIWNKEKWERLEKEKQDLIQIINQKNDELEELEIELSLTDFHNSRESKKHVDLTHEEIEKLRKEKLKEKIIAQSYQGQRNLEREQSQTDRTNFLDKLREKQSKIKELEKEVEHLKERLSNAQQKLRRTKTYQQNRTANLEKENSSLKIQLVYFKEQDKNLRITIQDLQNEANNHNCLDNCSLPHLPVPHVCPIVQQVNCSHSDYANLQSQLAEKERIIREQAQRIRELENKPPVVETKTVEKIKEVVKEVEKPTALLLEKIIEINLYSLEKELGIELSPKVKEDIWKVNNYQQLSSLRSGEIKSYLKKREVDTATIRPNQTGITKPNERLIWISLLVVSLLTIGGLLVRLRSAMIKERKRRIK